MGRDVVACDVDLQQLRWVREARGRDRAARRLDLVCADIGALPFRDGTFGSVIAGEVLEHVEHDGAAARELARALQPAGVAVVTVPAGADRFGPLDLAVGHFRRYDKAVLVRLLADAGLEVERVVGWGWPFGRLYDALVQRPALVRADGRGGGLLRRLGSSRVVACAWGLLFDVDALVDAGDRGSGMLAVARKSR
jgi:SAM-dependent methyltransferase